MSNQTQDKFKGFTLVWEGSPTEFIPVIKLWAAIPEDHLQVAKPANPNNIALWVANEHIDWANYRIMQTYRLANNHNLKRSQAEAKMKEYNQRLQEKCEQAPGKFMEDYRKAFADE